MKQIFLLFSFLSIAISCSKDDDSSLSAPELNDPDLQSVLSIIKGHRLTQGNLSLWFEYKADNTINFRDNAANEYLYKVTESRSVEVSQGDANMGTRAYFAGTTESGENIESYVTLLDEFNQDWGIHIATFLDESELTDQYFQLP